VILSRISFGNRPNIGDKRPSRKENIVEEKRKMTRIYASIKMDP
jgi:hypothetical protein